MITRRETTSTGPTVADALDAALEELGVQQDAVDYEILAEGGKGLFGMGSEKPAKVHVTIKESYLSELETAPDDAGDSEDDIGMSSGEIPDTPPPTTGAPRGRVVPEVDLSEEELDRVADEASSAVHSILGGFGITAEIEEYEGDENEIILDVIGDDLGVLIGRHGRTLDGIQTLVTAIVNRSLDYRCPILVDVEGYRNRRRVKLEEIARRAADRAARQSIPVKLRPMSSLERKVVHVCLRQDSRVDTLSEGEEPFRHVVVSPVK